MKSYRILKNSTILATLVLSLHAFGEWGQAPNGEFWNSYAVRFIYAPAFGFNTCEGATKYVYEVIDDCHRVQTFESQTPQASLAKIWDNLPVGYVTVICRAVASDGKTKGEAGRRTFWKKSAFDNSYPPPAKSFALAASRVFDAYCDMKQTKYLIQHGEPDPDYYLSGYPSKMLASQIEALLIRANGLEGAFRAKRGQLIDTAKRAADYLIAHAVPTESPLAGFTRTYANGGEYGRFIGEEDRIMLNYPATCGCAFLHLFRETKDERYKVAAKRIADTYVKLQGEDGSWFLLLNAKTGKEYKPVRLLPTGVMAFLEEAHRAFGDEAYRQAADCAFAYIEKGPMQDWNWVGQFEDVKPDFKRWSNLTEHPACAIAVYLLKRFPGHPERLKQAEDLIRFSEDQFVEWTPPYGERDPIGDNDDGTWKYFCRPYSRWMTPCALEQYACYHPIDASAARFINTYLAIWRVTHKSEYLAKARALGATATRMQEADGWINTWWMKGVERNDERYHTWLNCMLATGRALDNLAKAEKEERTQKVKPLDK